MILIASNQGKVFRLQKQSKANSLTFLRKSESLSVRWMAFLSGVDDFGCRQIQILSTSFLLEISVFCVAVAGIATTRGSDLDFQDGQNNVEIPRGKHNLWR